MVKANHYPVRVQTEDLYHSGIDDDILSIRTFYEQQWLDRGIRSNIYSLYASIEMSWWNPMWKSNTILTGVSTGADEVRRFGQMILKSYFILYGNIS